MLEQLHKDFPGDVQVVFRTFPLGSHDKSLITAQAAEAAKLQGQFWRMHDFLFANQNAWIDKTPADFEAWIKDQAAGLGLDAEAFARQLTSAEVVQTVLAAQQVGAQIGIPGTPFILINGKPYQGPRDIANLTAIVQLLQLQKRQFKQCPEMSIDPGKTYIATIKTDIGDIIVRLFADKAPFTVNSFIFLARNGWYDGVIFHRVIPGFVAQAGDPSGTGYGGPGYAYSNEIYADAHYDRPGLLGMANSGPTANGSQFFITYEPVTDLDGGYTIFGEVISGMDVAQRLTPRDPQQGGELPPGSKIITIQIQEQ